MATNIALLGSYRALASVDPEEDWIGAMMFRNRYSGQPIRLDGVDFKLSLLTLDDAEPVWAGSTLDGTITIGGDGNSAITWVVFADDKMDWAGVYRLRLDAFDTLYNKAIFAEHTSSLSIGEPNTLNLTPIGQAQSAVVASVMESYSSPLSLDLSTHGDALLLAL